MAGAMTKCFRVVAIARDVTGNEIKYTDQTNQYRAHINSWKGGS